jgi:hypothetical protein
MGNSGGICMKAEELTSLWSLSEANLLQDKSETVHLQVELLCYLGPSIPAGS